MEHRAVYEGDARTSANRAGGLRVSFPYSQRSGDRHGHRHEPGQGPQRTDRPGMLLAGKSESLKSCKGELASTTIESAVDEARVQIAPARA